MATPDGEFETLEALRNEHGRLLKQSKASTQETNLREDVLDFLNRVAVQ